jgi:serine/threonine-protein kinase
VSLAPGTSFDRYTIEDLLGQGGMGEVYRAYDPKLDRRIALKIVRVASDIDGRGAARLVQEARSAAALHHPNVVTVFDVGEVDGVSYITMEYVTGRSLRACVGDRGITLDRRVRWLLDVARGLAAAHARGLVHRDVKPENVIVADGDDVAKVLDFGIARQAHDVSPLAQTAPVSWGATLTKGSAFVGTPRYMAPEQLLGEPVDARADQFAWGVTAYELLTGVLPWRFPSDGPRLVAEILAATVTPPSGRGLTLPAAVDVVVQRALAKDPHDRFRDMNELATQLEPFAGRSPSGPVQDDGAGRSPIQPASSRARPRARRRALLGGLAVLVCVPVVSILTLGARRSPSTVASAVPSSSSSAAPVVGTAVAAIPLPTSSKPEAVAAYARAMQRWHDGDDGYISDLRGAIALDPLLGAAYLRLANSPVTGLDPDRARIEETTVALRSTMSERDQGILDAFSGQTADDVRRALDALVARYPGDAEILFHWAASRRSQDPTAFERVISVDPTFTRAYSTMAEAQSDALDFDASMATAERCLKQSPHAAACIDRRNDLLDVQGRCAEVEEGARESARFVGHATIELAAALAAQGQRGDVVQAALDGWLSKRASEPGTEALRLSYAARLDVLEGDFAGAQKAWRALADSSGPLEWTSKFPAPDVQLVQIAIETGRDAEASRLAGRAFGLAGATSIERDGRPFFAAVVDRASARDPHERASDAERWVQEQVLNGYPHDRWKLWMDAYAMPAFTPADARVALVARPSFPAFFQDNQHYWETPQFYEGKMLLLAGRVDEAVPQLRFEARSCGALHRPLEHTWANLALGDALEQKGDREGACAAFAVVVQRWGAATPASVSARHARARMTALHCGG